MSTPRRSKTRDVPPPLLSLPPWCNHSSYYSVPECFGDREGKDPYEDCHPPAHSPGDAADHSHIGNQSERTVRSASSTANCNFLTPAFSFERSAGAH